MIDLKKVGYNKDIGRKQKIRKEINMISSIIIGALCGWIASMIMKTDDQMGAIANIVVGIVGGAIGSWILGIVNINVSGFVGSLIAGILGSVILIYIYNLITKKTK